MPVTIKASNLKYKDTSGEYVGVNSISDMTTAEQLAAINEAGTTKKNAIDTAGANHLSAINTAGTNHLSAINTAGATQTTAVNNAGATQVAAVNSAGTTQVTAVQDKGDEVLESIPSDYSELTEDVNSLMSAIGDLEQTLDNGYFTYNNYISGARNKYNTIDQNAARCTTAKSFALNEGDTITVSNVDSGLKYAIACVKNNAFAYDGGWKTSNFSYTVASGKDGNYFVNIAYSDGTTAINPSDISTLLVTITPFAELRKIDSSESKCEELDGRVNNAHNYINYNYDTVLNEIPADGGTDATCVGYKRVNTIFTINGNSSTMNYAFMCIDAVGNGGRTTSSSTIKSSLPRMEFQTGHTYKITLEVLSGSATLNADNYIPTVSVYRNGESSNCGVYSSETANGYSTQFTQETGRTYAICIYILKNVVFTDFKIRLLVEDLDADMGIYLSEIDDTITKVRALQIEPSIVFPLITDIHYSESEDDKANWLFTETTIKNMREVLSQIRADCTVCLGDIVEGNSNTYTSEYATTINNLFRHLNVPYLLAIGNHDDNRYATTFTEAEMYAYYSAFTDNTVVFNPGTNGRDYYIDFPNYSARFIVLDSNTVGSYGFPSECVSWFSNTALDTPSGYLAIVLVHQSPIATQNYNNYAVTNGTDIASAIEAYQTGGKPIVQFYGHSHVDVSFTSPYLSIGTNCAKFENTNGDPALYPDGATKPSRTKGTVTEECWDMVVVRPISRKIDCVRFGAGNDRSFTY